MNFLALVLNILSVMVVIVYSTDYPSLPSIELMAYGFDLNKFTLFSPNTKNDGRGNKPVFEFTYNKSTHWTHPVSNITYKQPDQVASITAYEMGLLNSSIALSRTIEEYGQNSYDIIGKPEIPFADQLFGTTNIFGDTWINDFIDKRILATAFAPIKSYLIVLQKSIKMQLSSSFLENISKLNGTYLQNTEAYDNFLQQYGTHYLTKSLFGGAYIIKAITLNKFALHKTDHELLTYMKAVIYIICNGSHVDLNLTNEETSMPPEFVRTSMFTTNGFGGSFVVHVNSSYAYLDNEQLHEWEQNIPNEPFQIGGYTKPIYKLIDNNVIHYEMKMATFARIAKDILRQLNYILVNLKRNDSDVIPNLNSTIGDVKKSIETNLKLTMPPPDQVYKLQVAIFEYISYINTL